MSAAGELVIVGSTSHGLQRIASACVSINRELAVTKSRIPVHTVRATGVHLHQLTRYLTRRVACGAAGHGPSGRVISYGARCSGHGHFAWSADAARLASLAAKRYPKRAQPNGKGM
jgi:hypothetical protein